MKTNLTKTIFSFFAAIYFIVAGLGLNYVNYCCQACANEGIESVALLTCSTLHHHLKAAPPAESKDDITCPDVEHKPQGCHFVRLKVDVPSVNPFYYNVPLINTIFLTNLFCSQPLFGVNNFEGETVNIRPPNSLSVITGRDLITFHSVLLI